MNEYFLWMYKKYFFLNELFFEWRNLHKKLNEWLNEWKDAQKIAKCVNNGEIVINIARGTTDPGYRVYNLNYLFNYIEFVFILALVLVQNLTTRWCHQNWFQIWPTCNAISIGSNFGHQVALLALVTNLVTRWRHLH